MSEESKERQRQRFRKQLRHLKTREEEQRIAAARKARAFQKPRAEIDAEDTVQKIRRRERVLGPARPRVARDPNTAEVRATVVGLARGRARVRAGDGERDAVLAPELAAAQQSEIAVGDEVIVHERRDAEPLVASVLPRRSELARVDPENPARRRVLAANVDLAVLVLSADRLRAGLIDRLALALAGSGAQLAVCVNKCDLPHDAEAREAALAPHRAMELPIVVASATRGDGVEELRALVAGRCCAFVGHSGVGKSTLLNRLDPEHARATGEVRARDGRGRHTTSASSLRILADGTRLIDTPGVRAFGLEEGATDAAAAFTDIGALAAGCRFRDCAHRSEPGCAVRAAVESGALAEERYAAFLRITGGG